MDRNGTNLVKHNKPGTFIIHKFRSYLSAYYNKNSYSTSENNLLLEQNMSKYMYIPLIIKDQLLQTPPIVSYSTKTINYR